MKLQRDVGRTCGECTGCCKPFVVKAIGKNHRGWCHHSVARKGCKIHKDRPPDCRHYFCLWMNGAGDESYRPDRLGAVLDVRDLKLGTREIGVLHVFEIRRFALDSAQIQRLVEVNKEAGHVVIQYRMNGPQDYTNLAQWRGDKFTAEEEREIREHLSRKDPSAE